MMLFRLIHIALPWRISWITELVKHVANTGKYSPSKATKRPQDDREEEKLDVNEGQKHDQEDAG